MPIPNRYRHPLRRNENHRATHWVRGRSRTPPWTPRWSSWRSSWWSSCWAAAGRGACVAACSTGPHPTVREAAPASAWIDFLNKCLYNNNNNNKEMSVQYQSKHPFFNGCLYGLLVVCLLMNIIRVIIIISVITVCFCHLSMSHRTDLNEKCIDSTGTTPRPEFHATWMPYLSRVQWVFRTHMFLWPHHRAWSDQSCCVSGRRRSKIRRQQWPTGGLQCLQLMGVLKQTNKQIKNQTSVWLNSSQATGFTKTQNLFVSVTDWIAKKNQTQTSHVARQPTNTTVKKKNITRCGCVTERALASCYHSPGVRRRHKYNPDGDGPLSHPLGAHHSHDTTITSQWLRGSAYLQRAHRYSANGRITVGRFGGQKKGEEDLFRVHLHSA